MIHVRNKMRRLKLAVGSDGRNRTVLWPFTSKTSRTQPKASQWIFSPAVWLRSLIRPEPGQALAYIDYSAMEFLIAAALSGDRIMLDLYNTGDPYTEFANRVGAIPSNATEEQVGVIRDRYKVLLLATQYGMMTERWPRGWVARPSRRMSSSTSTALCLPCTGDGLPTGSHTRSTRESCPPSSVGRAGPA